MKLFTGIIPNYPVSETFYIAIRRFTLDDDKWLFKFIATNGYSYELKINSIELNTYDYREAVKTIFEKILISHNEKLNDNECSPYVENNNLKIAIDNITEIIL